MKEVAFEIVVGTYEQFLLGYKYTEEVSELKQSFAVRSHTGSIKCLDAADRYLASGGSDDRIFVYDLISRKEHCMLTQHNASVNSVQFTPDRTHILSGCADGTLTIVRVGNWQLEKLWEKAHRGAILDIAIHKTGKLALTLGSDRSLKTWNLIKGRQAYVINLNSKSADPTSLEHIYWAPCGERFALVGGQYTEIWSIEKGGILNAIQHTSKVTSCTWWKNDVLLTGYENGKIAFVNTETSDLDTKECHSSRVKCISLSSDHIITASSNGEIKVWDEDFKEVAKCNTGCRITCLTIALPISVKEDKPDIKNDETLQLINESENETVEEQPPKKKKKKHVKNKIQ